MADTTPDITDTAQTVLTPFERNTLEKAEAWFEASFSGYDRAGAGTCPAPEAVSYTHLTLPTILRV